MTDEQSPQASDYLARFGLQREPFAADPDPEFFCADSALTQRLDMLQNLTEFGMLTLLVIGEPGVGKTSVLQQYMKRANSNWRVCHLAADALGNAHDLVRDLAAGFLFPGADLAQLRTQLDEMQCPGTARGTGCGRCRTSAGCRTADLAGTVGRGGRDGKTSAPGVVRH